MKKIMLFILVFSSCIGLAKAQNQDSTALQISGSADLYYKYDFALSDTNKRAGTNPNPDYPNNTLGNKLNELDFSMLDLRLKKRVGKTTFFSDLAFGARTDNKSNNPQNSFKIQNLYLTHQFTKELAVSAGAMYKFQSFERITPVDNFNYSMSKSYELTFANSFQRAGGIKVNYAFSDKINWTVGLYNSVDAKAADDGIASLTGYWVSDFCTQLFVHPIDNLDISAAYWREGQTVNGTHTNLQVKYSPISSLKLGLDATSFSAKDSALGTSGTSFKSLVFYAQKSICKGYSIGARYEYNERTEKTYSPSYTTGYYNIFTLTSNVKLGPLSLKQEIMVENTNKGNTNSLYHDKSGNASFGATQLVLAAVYAF